MHLKIDYALLSVVSATEPGGTDTRLLLLLFDYYVTDPRTLLRFEALNDRWLLPPSAGGDKVILSWLSLKAPSVFGTGIYTFGL